MAAWLKQGVQLLRPQPSTGVDVENVTALVNFEAFPVKFQNVIYKVVLSVNLLDRAAPPSDTTYHIGWDLQSVVSCSDWLLSSSCFEHALCSCGLLPPRTPDAPCRTIRASTGTSQWFLASPQPSGSWLQPARSALHCW